MLRIASLMVVMTTLPSCATPMDGDIEVVEQPAQWPTNGAANTAIALNAIFTNETMNRRFASQSLNQLVSQIGVEIEDADTRKAFEYYVSCGLCPEQSVNVTGASGTVYNFKGSGCMDPFLLDWAPTPQGQQIMSACLAARGNAQGKQVQISQRGLLQGFWGDVSMPVANPLLPVTELGVGNPVDSSRACTGTTWGVTSNCGWKQGYVGRCAPGYPVTVAAGSGGLGTQTPASGDTMLRICRTSAMPAKALRTCNHNEALAYNDDGGIAPYGYAPRVTFTCPSDGLFLSMWRPYNSASSDTANPGASAPYYLQHPTSELSAFRWPDVVLYGNMFLKPVHDPNDPLDTLPVEVTVTWDAVTHTSHRTITPRTGYDAISYYVWPYNNMFACEWGERNDKINYAYGRLCAYSGQLGKSSCAAHFTGACSSVCGAYNENDDSWRSCRDPYNRTWGYPDTVSLLDSCDLDPNPSAGLCVQPAPPG